jgi:NTP pyrophosphatase (non-canonical NTP hydrolase)
MNSHSIQQLAEHLRQFAAERDWEQFHSPKNLAMALSVEVAEIAEHFQWLTEQQSQDLDAAKKAEVAEELADALIYLVRLAPQLQIDLLDAADRKLAINEAKYPAEQVRGSARKYSEYD